MSAKRTGRRMVVFLAAALLASGAAVAQMQSGGMGQQNTPGQQPGEQPGQMPSTGSNIPDTIPSTAPSMMDQAFVRFAMESNVAEVQLGQLAEQKSQSDDIKQFGQRVVVDRQRLAQQLEPIAKELDVHQPKEPSKKDKQLIAKLATLSGPQFDQEYIKAVLKDHEKEVKDFKTAAESSQDPNVERAAKMDTPVLEQHLQTIQQIAQAHNVNTEESKK